jgi:hypothetical protein
VREEAIDLIIELLHTRPVTYQGKYFRDLSAPHGHFKDAEKVNHPDARATAQTAAQEIEVALQQSSALTEVRQELIAAALEHVKDSVCLLAERP